ncbi:hypothetical protein Tco_0616903, partial [Tanacetum coccineum]
MNEIVSNLFQATLFRPTDLQFLLRHEVLTCSYQPLLFSGGAVDVLSRIGGIFEDILMINLDLL